MLSVPTLTPVLNPRNALVLAAWLLLASTPGSARPWLCLPPAFEGGQRLHGFPWPRIHWLELLLRQHALCWRSAATPDELRIVLVGNSAEYGFPLPAEQAVGARLNEHLAANGVHAHVFNLGFVNPYQVRDAVIIRAALAYEPNVIVYPLTLVEFNHIAPMPYPTIIQFFDSNRTTLAEMIADPPRGLEEPFAKPREFIDFPHVSTEGHRLIADQIARMLDPLLRGLAGRRAEEKPRAPGYRP